MILCLEQHNSLCLSPSQSFCLCLSVSVSLCVCLWASACVPACLSFYLLSASSVCLSVSVCLTLSLPACLCLSVCVCVCLSLSVHVCGWCVCVCIFHTLLHAHFRDIEKANGTGVNADMTWHQPDTPLPSPHQLLPPWRRYASPWQPPSACTWLVHQLSPSRFTCRPPCDRSQGMVSKSQAWGLAKPFDRAGCFTDRSQ